VNLKEYRHIARDAAVQRDGGFCMICKWTCGITTPYAEVHHVFGRGATSDSVKEKFTSLMCVCRACHPQPILLPPYASWQFEILTVWRNMNCSPHGDVVLPTETAILNPVGLPVFKVDDGIVTDWRI
jgi:hypothetical protein